MYWNTILIAENFIFLDRTTIVLKIVNMSISVWRWRETSDPCFATWAQKRRPTNELQVTSLFVCCSCSYIWSSGPHRQCHLWYQLQNILSFSPTILTKRSFKIKNTVLGWKKPNINQGAIFENRTFSFSLQPRSLWSFNLFYFLIYKDDDSDLPSSPLPLLSTRNSQILQITAVIIRKDARNIFNENFRVVVIIDISTNCIECEL